MGENKAEPLAKTRTRRSNAGARMHEMMFAAEDDELFAQTYGGLLKADEDSSEDEEYVPKDFDATGNGADLDDVDDDDDADADHASDSDGTSNSDSDSEDDDDDDDDEEENGFDEAQDDLEAGIYNRSVKSEKDLNLVGNKHDREQPQSPQKSQAIDIQTGSPSKAALEACAKICSVCLGDQSNEDDEIIECDACGVSVHESCYGVAGDEDASDDDNNSVHSNMSSESTEPWFCEPCKRSVKNPFCELCPNTGGIFKQTDTGRWVHVVCALYIRGVTFENVETLSEVSLFELPLALYGSKACTICEDRRLSRSGISIGCDAGLCKNFFHATCAQREGLLFESHADEVDPYFAHCKQHADKSVIRKKKRICTALLARLRRLQPLQNCSDRIKKKLAEITQEPDPHLTRWRPDNRPPILPKVGRLLMTSPSLIIRLTKKSELKGLDPKSAFMSVQDEMEMARQKWHIPPAFNLEFVAYCRDRTTRMTSMQRSNVELVHQNETLKREESLLREKFNSIKDMVTTVRSENEALIREARSLQKLVTAATGKQFSLPLQMELLIASRSNSKGKSPSKASKGSTKTNSTFGCGKCGTVKDQHLLALCDTCHAHFHIYCLDPPLTRVPKKTKFGGWQCSDCSERDEEEQEEALEEQNIQAIQEADGPRRLRERIKFPDKYCHESMMIADFWSSSKRKRKSKSRSSKPKQPKIEV